ncbi:Hypothetical protein RY67_300 [Bifidobacterium longum subsp. infantis]|uniref:Uncharacterized protein n=1 Tax=Bifidobacterium longum subsp. infantis TaxID=1682 RepID=A0A0M4MCV6_BIFLI|nr:Hypothetical protein RY67_300 [Bifidobacterium longum subsp. infantis]
MQRYAQIALIEETAANPWLQHPSPLYRQQHADRKAVLE